MYSVISTLDPASTEVVNNLRNRLQNRSKALRRVATLEPHMSWLGAEGGNLAFIADRLNTIAHSITRLKLETAGFGIFPGPAPVLYLPVISTEQLLRIHKELWRQLSDEIIQGNEQYGPDQWVPHITIFDIEEQNVKNLGRALEDLVMNDFHIEFTLSKFELAYYQNDKHGYYSSHPFS